MSQPMPQLSPDGEALLFTDARTHRYFLDKPVPAETLRRLYDLAKLGPTTGNCQPMRVVFVATPAGKERLIPCLSPNNIDKVKSAPVTAIVAADSEFYEHMPRLWTADPNARSWFAGNDAAISFAMTLNGGLQGAFLIQAARSLGLDCGPMGGFDKAKVDAEFLAGTPWKSLFLCNIGYGDASRLHPRNDRFAFDEACKIV